MTASIDPGNTPKVNRGDIIVREKDYINALEFYISTGYPIVFCENSSYDSEKIHNIISQYKHVEYLKLISKESPLGKGHGEKEIMNYVFEHSENIRNCEYVIKVTGRLIVENIQSIIKKIENQEFILSVNIVRNLEYTDSRFFIFKKDFFKSYFLPVLNAYLDERKGVVFEICLARAFHLCMSEGKRCTLLPVYPQYTGHSAWDNRRLNRGFYRRIKYRLYYWIKLYIFRQTI
jgi:hypothetical protein